MKLAKFAESDRGKRISEILLRKGRLIGLLLYCVGIGVYCAFPAEGYHRKKFFDENALLTGLVKREFTNATLIATLQSQYRQNLESSSHNWIHDVLADYGLEAYTQHYTSDCIIGFCESTNRTNTYAILRAGKSPSVEAIILTAPDTIGSDQENAGVAVLLALASYFSSKTYWAKDIIFLVTSGGVTGTQAWLNAYMGTPSTVLQSEPLTGRSGALQAVINIEIGTGDIHYINVIPEGVNAILPNLDLVFVASTMCEMERLPITYHLNWDSPGMFSPVSAYFRSVLTSVLVLFHHAAGLPLSNHAPFLFHRIDSVTLRSINGISNYQNHQLRDFARALEGIFRSVNNLLERLHHSEFFYINMSRNTFVSIGQYSSFFGFVLAPLLLESLRRWLLFKSGNSSAGKTFYEKMGIPPQLSVSLKPLSYMFTLSLGGGCCMYFTPPLLTACGLAITPPLLLACIGLVWLSFSSCSFFFRPTMTGSSYNLSCSFVLLLSTILLYSLALMHFSFSFLLSIFVVLPFSFSTSNKFLSHILMLIVSPPLLIVYVCLGYTVLFSTQSTFSVYEQFMSSLELLLTGVEYSYYFHHMSSAWLYPLICLMVCPLWLVCWSLGLTKIKENANTIHPHSD